MSLARAKCFILAGCYCASQIHGGDLLKESTLTTVAWGIFILFIGCLWIVAESTRLDMGSYFALGVGLS